MNKIERRYTGHNLYNEVYFPRDIIGLLIISIINRPFILFIIAFGYAGNSD